MFYIVDWIKFYTLIPPVKVGKGKKKGKGKKNTSSSTNLID